MSTDLTVRSRRRVKTTLAELERTFGSIDIVEDEWSLSTDRYDTTVDRFEAGTVGGAGAWIRNDDGEVLLVQQEDGDNEQDVWSDPGGKQEPGETLPETALREVREEAGIVAQLDGVGFAEIIDVSDRERNARPPLVRLIVVFTAEYVEGTPTPADGEITDVRWWSKKPDELRYEALNQLNVPAESADRS